VGDSLRDNRLVAEDRCINRLSSEKERNSLCLELLNSKDSNLLYLSPVILLILVCSVVIRLRSNSCGVLRLKLVHLLCVINE